MAEDEASKEDKFDFTSEGETLGYISLEQARLVAMQVAREKPGNYGPQPTGTRLVFQLVEQEEGEDYYIVTLSFRPEGNLTGSPGQEQFFIEKEGTVADRQVLSLPSAGHRRSFPVIPAVIGAGMLGVAMVAGIVFAAGGLGSGGDAERPVEALVPTNTPASIATPGALAAVAPTDAPTPFRITTATPPPAAIAVPTPALSIPATALPLPTPVPIAAQPVQFQFLRSWGSEGSGDGQFDRPMGIAIDQAGNVYVADRNNHRVQVFDSNGRFLLKWGSENSGNGQFDLLWYVAVDGASNVYVSDSGNHRVQVFAPVWPSPSAPVPTPTP